MSLFHFIRRFFIIAPIVFLQVSANAGQPASPFDSSPIPDWVRMATIGGFDAWVEMENHEIDALISQRTNENVSVLEVDSGLSNYLTDAEFQTQVNFLTNVANRSHAAGLKAVVYYPSLEVTTPNGENIPQTMFKEHPEWVQYGINGEPNVFYGSQEVWVEPGMESAWMSPNTGYRDYFINRVQQLATSGLDGIWIDVPIYLSTGAAWAGAEPAAAAAFQQWSIDTGLAGGGGFSVPTSVDWSNPVFRAWVRWRHENLADFLNDVRAAAHSLNPDFMVIVENFPADYMDASEAGLDGNYRRSNQNFLRVWEIDSVSNTKAMTWATVDEFSNKIAMYKWARAADRENPSWGFSYGNQPLDAGLTMAAAIATSVTPFEAQTPEMVLSVDSAFRSQWFGFVQNNKQALLNVPRHAETAIWYSSPTRDFADYQSGGGYGMYITTTPPTNDDNWWATEPGDSALPKPHLGGYRGAAHAFNQLHIPYKIVSDPGSPATELEGVRFLWLPSVQAISDEHATLIENFVAEGGIVFATGEVPGTLDEWGNTRSESAFKSLFNLNFGNTPHERTNTFGDGLAVYNPTVRGADMFASVGDETLANEALSTVEQLVRIHVKNQVLIDGPKGIFADIGKASDTEHHLYLVNYSGLKLPLEDNPQTVNIQYRAPDGYEVTGATVAAPDDGQQGALNVIQTAEQYYGFDVHIDQFSLITLTLQPKAPTLPEPWVAPQWLDSTRQEAAESGLDFIVNSMRHSDKPEPYAYGVYTNLIDDAGLTEIYAHGHHVTAEHMGLTLRVSACMGDLNTYDESWRYVRDVMAAPDYRIVNWAIDRDTAKPLVFLDDVWKNSNAPLDDFRVLRGLFEGASAAGNVAAPELAKELLSGMYWTSVTDRDYKTQLDFPTYPSGLVGYAWDWEGTTDASLSPPAIATGIGVLTIDPVPTDYNDLFMIAQAAKYDPQWQPVLISSTDLLINAEIGTSGLFYNGYESNGNWTGDFENRDTNQGQHIKVIQSLWIALHLYEASKLDPGLLDGTRATQAGAAAARALGFFKNFYQNNGRIPEYLTYQGNDVPNCILNNIPNKCLVPNDENLINGEARIYALLARLALYLGDTSFASTLIEQKILTDRISDPSDPRYGVIGVSTAGTNDAEAWNILESTLTLCLEAKSGAAPNNSPPVAFNQSIQATEETAIAITLLASDADNDALSYQLISQPQHGALSGVGANLVYTPAGGFTGTDSFSFVANDGQVDSNQAVVSIEVSPTVPNNRAPVANDLSQQTEVNTPLALILTASDPDNDPLSYQLLGQPANGTLTGSPPNLTYAPNTGYTGPDSFTFRVSDGQLFSNIAVVNIAVAPVNLPPVAENNSVVTQQETPVAITLSASDPNNDALVYTIVDSPLHGTLSGSAQIRTYQPSASFVGSDSFTFRVNDGQIDSNLATITISVEPNNPSNPIVSNPVGGMIMDGNFDDWAGLRAFAADPDDVAGSSNKADWLNGWMAHNSDSFFVSYTNDGAIDTVNWWGWQTYFDTDNNPNTGYRVGAIGAEYSLEDNIIRHYTGNGTNWNWSIVGYATYQVASDRTEFAFPRAWLANSSDLRVVFIAENIAFPGGTTQDNYPDGVFNDTANVRYFEYSTDGVVVPPDNQPPVASDQSVSVAHDTAKAIALVANDPDGDALTFTVVSAPANGVLTGTAPNITYTPNAGFSGSDNFTFLANDGQINSNTATVTLSVQTAPSGGDVSNPGVSIVVDGNLSDWAGLTSFGDDPQDVSGAANKVDWQQAWVAHDDDRIYIAYINHGPIDQNNFWGWAIYLDTDSNANTAYGIYSLGAEYLIDDGHIVRKYIGERWDWSWSEMGIASVDVNDNFVEMSFPRSWTGNDTTAFRIGFVGDNTAFNGGSGEDHYPDGLDDTSAAIRYFSYKIQ